VPETKSQEWIPHDFHGFKCKTTCLEALEEDLWTYFISHVVIDIIFLIIPIFLTWWQIRSEKNEVRKEREGKDASEEKQNKPVYSLLQYQAKCCANAPYEYYSWGGSQVEDFLELVIGFALLTSFSIVLPGMAFVTFVSHLLEYRLLAFRTTHVTCRPWPTGADGIGLWDDILNFLGFVAVTSNIGIAIFVMNPMQMWRLEHQLAAFLILEHALLFIREGIRASIPDEPGDVRRIDNVHSDFLRKVLKRKEYDFEQDEQSVGLIPEFKNVNGPTEHLPTPQEGPREMN